MKKHTDIENLPHFNRKEMEDRLEGEEEILMELIKNVEENIMKNFIKLETAIIEKDRKKIKEISHQFIGMSRSMTFERLAVAFKYIYDNEDIDGLINKTEEIKKEIEMVLKEIKS